MRILLTGATGFIGSQLAHRLCEAKHRVVALTRPSSRTGALEALGVTVYRGDLCKEDDILPALEGVEAVVHAAGGGHCTDGVATLYRSNRDTTRALVRAARRVPSVSRFVLVSSMAAQGPSPDGRVPRTVEAPRPQSHYGRSKAQAEDLVLDRDNPFGATVLRPPTIYGPGDDRLLPLFRAIKRGFALLPAAARASSWVHVQDCAAAIEAALAEPHDHRAIFGVADGPARPWPEAVQVIGDAVGRRARIVPVPTSALRLAALGSEWMGRIRGRSVLFTRDKVSDLQHAWWVVDHRALPEHLTWRARVNFEDGIRETARWYEERGAL